jgi:cytoskeletal protein CcmA (bactofilin family)
MLFGRKSSQERNRAAPGREREAPKQEAPRPPTATNAPPASQSAPQTPRPPASADDARSQSYIDASLTIMGDLSTEGDVQLDGRVCGNVSCAQLIVGRDGAITGSVTAQEAVIRGIVTGSIRAPVVILQEPARVESDIVYTVLAIDDGASFEGAARRSEHPLEEPKPDSQLAELQAIVRAAAEPAGRPNGHVANSHDPAPAASGTDGSAAPQQGQSSAA